MSQQRAASLWRRLWNRIVVDTFHRTEEEARLANADSRPRLDFEVAVVLITSAVSLTLIHYIGKGGEGRLELFLQWLGFDSLAAGLQNAMQHSPSQRFNRLAFFAICCITGYLIIPAAVIKFVFRKRLNEFGLKFRGMFRDAWVYGAMLLFMVPAVFTVSFTPAFQASYPFYDLAPGESLWPYFYGWEVLYALQFVALEFFFRGFMVHGTRRRLGFYSIFVMMVPYCMIHFGKPMLETFAAILAGIALGIMSLKTKSIWLGAALHIAVAWLMDALALWHGGVTR